MATRIRLGKQLQLSSTPASILYTNADNELTYLAPSGGQDLIPFYDDSGVVLNWLTLGTNLSISGTVLNATAGAGGYATVQEEGVTVGGGNTTINFLGSGITAADAGGGVTSITVASFLNTLATQGNVDLTADVTGLLPLANLADGLSLSVLGRASNTNGVMASIQAAADNQVLRRNGTSIGFGAINLASTNAVTGVLDEANGGTGLSSYAQGDIIYASAANTLAALSIGTSATYLKGGTTPSWATLNVAALSDAANVALLDGNQTFTGINVFDENITMNGTPSAATDVITVGYLNTVLANQSKTQVQYATTGNITLSGEQTIDGFLTSSSVVLVKDQTAPAQNGIYTTASGAWTRHASMDTAAEVDGTFVIVQDGTLNAGTFWYTVSEVTTLGTDAIDWVRLDKATDITAGNGLSFSGLTLNVGTASTARIVVNANDIDLATTTATPGAFGSATQVANFTVDSYGRLTASGNTAIAIPSTAITDFQEAVEDVVGGLVTDTTGVTWTYTDAANTLEVNVDTLYTANGTIPNTTTRTVTLGNTSSALTFVNAGATQLLNIDNDSVDLFTNVLSATSAGISVTGTNTTLGVNANFALTLSGAATSTITDSRTTTVGLQYAADYSADFTDRTLVDKGYVDAAITAATTTVNRYYIENSTGTTFDLDAGGGVIKDVDGTNATATIPADRNLVKIFRNGILINESGSLTTRDYSLNHTTHVVTLEDALTASEILLIEITQ